MARPIMHRISAFLGLTSLNSTGRDAYLIITLRSCRMFSAGIPSLILALFFASLGFKDWSIGLFMTLTLLGDVLLSLILTLVADSLGRRKILFFGSAMMALSGTAFALSENYYVLLVAAVCGVISVTGSDCGPFRAIEESVLSGLTDDKTRSDVLTWYVTATTLAGAVGTEVAGRTVQFIEGRENGNETQAFHFVFWVYAAFGVIGCVVSLGLSERCEVAGEKSGRKDGAPRKGGEVGSHEEEEEVMLEAMTPSTVGSFEAPGTLAHRQRDLRTTQPSKSKPSYISQISKPTRSIMYKLWLLLAIDSLADGMTPYSLMNYYIEQKFALSKASLGDITSASQFLCAVSSIFAGPLSRRIGLINTMVFTHLPSSLASAFIPLPPTVGWTVFLLLFRAALNSMDQAPRTAFIAAVVRPQERTGVMGITAMVRTLASSLGPSITGLLGHYGTFWAAFVATGICRVAYDLGLWVLFVNVKVDGKRPGEEAEGDEDGEYRGSVDEEAWNGLLSETDSEGEGSARESKDSSRDGLKSV
ncbi:MFS transporter-like protein [Lophiostoma macrostomum CBS 122681]|uniref:MFS transporter-like protein n=1 Tax=Lophiostoma macrostomum CBS 122681 TaxID=1314788 RepID=A0A6A6SKX1_9PLEO|nr:MFS transporter-like protein [Lophiostoma macrostomum CBS 122681]